MMTAVGGTFGRADSSSVSSRPSIGFSAERLEVVRRDHHAAERLAAVGQRPGNRTSSDTAPAARTTCACRHARIHCPIVERSSYGLPVGPCGRHQHEPARIGVGRRRQQHALNQAEHGRRRADAEGERRHGDQREARVLVELTDRIANVVAHGLLDESNGREVYKARAAGEALGWPCENRAWLRTWTAMDEPIARLAALLKESRRVTVLTGAGVSAASGVPTFRGSGGLWRSYDPMTLATPQAFAKDPTLVWEWYDWRRQLIAAAQPNPAHHVIAEWSRTRPDSR